MRTIVLLTFWLTASIHLSYTIDLQHYCPYDGFCSGSPSLTLNDSRFRSCCWPCSCSDDCVLFGNCCPDKPIYTEQEPTYLCRSQQDVYANGRSSAYLESDQNIMFRIVDRCSTSAYADVRLTKSVQRCHEAQTLQDLAFVSDPKNEKIYLNKHCAKCNDVHDVAEWNLLVLCHSVTLLDFPSIEEWHQYIFENCSVRSKPPTDVFAQKSICLLNTIRTCNVTGLWDVYDWETERKCHLYDAPFEKNLMETYANVFCFVCNSPNQGSTFPSKCEAVYDTKTSFEYPFTALLTFTDINTELQQPSRVEAKQNCKSTEVLDPLMVSRGVSLVTNRW